PLARAGRHDGATVALARRRTQRFTRLGERAALRGRARFLSAHAPRCAGRATGGRVHPAGSALPAFGLPLGAAGRGVPAGARSVAGRSARPAQRGAAAARARPQRTGIPPARCPAGRSEGPARRVAADLSRGHRSDRPAVLPRRALGDVDRFPPARRTGEGAGKDPRGEGDRMSRRLRVVHTTEFGYESAVTGSFNEARLTPRSDARQNVILNRVTTAPATHPYRYTDYWGTAVTAFDVNGPHDALTVSAYSVVETEPAAVPDRGGCGWPELRSERPLDTYAELRAAPTHVPDDAELRAAAAELAAGVEPAEAVLRAANWVHSAMTYVPGATSVHTSAVQA